MYLCPSLLRASNKASDGSQHRKRGMDPVADSYIIWVAPDPRTGLHARDTLSPQSHVDQITDGYSRGRRGVEIEKVGRRRSEVGTVELPRTKKLFFANFKPVPGMKVWILCGIV